MFNRFSVSSLMAQRPEVASRSHVKGLLPVALGPATRLRFTRRCPQPWRSARCPQPCRRSACRRPQPFRRSAPATRRRFTPSPSFYSVAWRGRPSDAQSLRACMSRLFTHSPFLFFSFVWRGRISDAQSLRTCMRCRVTHHARMCSAIVCIACGRYTHTHKQRECAQSDIASEVVWLQAAVGAHRRRAAVRHGRCDCAALGRSARLLGPIG